MPDVAGNPSLDARWRPWHALALLVAAHAVLNVILNPMRDRGNEFPILLWMGVFFVQPVLIATWITMGPPPAMKRIPLSVAGFILLLFASCVPRLLGRSNNFPLRPVGLEILVMPAMLFAAALIAMFLLQIVTRWRIRNSRAIEVGTLPANQFSIKYLLVLTAVCAVVLGVGRALFSSVDWSNYPSWRDIGGLIARIWIILLVMLPAIALPIVALLPRPTPRIILVASASSVILSLVAIETIILLDNPPRGDVTLTILSVQLGAVLASVASALLLRFAGYRLARRSRAGSISQTAILT